MFVVNITDVTFQVRLQIATVPTLAALEVLHLQKLILKVENKNYVAINMKNL